MRAAAWYGYMPNTNVGYVHCDRNQQQQGWHGDHSYYYHDDDDGDGCCGDWYDDDDDDCCDADNGREVETHRINQQCSVIIAGQSPVP